MSNTTKAEYSAQEVAEKNLELLVKIAAREQRYACAEKLNNPLDNHDAVIQNTPCPDVTETIRKWRAELAKEQS